MLAPATRTTSHLAARSLIVPASSCLRQRSARRLACTSRLYLASTYSTAAAAFPRPATASPSPRTLAAALQSRPPSPRRFTNSPVSSAERPASVRDSEPDNGLYYHPTEINISDGTTERPTNVWALSLLSQPPSSSNSKAIVAFLLPPKGSSADLHAENPAEYIRANPDRISVNPEFWALMHETLKTEVVPTDELLDFEASTRKSGWAHLTDLRHPLNPGRIATPESIIASVAFVDGVLEPESYEANASYRLVTGYEGPIHMPQGWIDKIRARVQELN
ncbi:hypothetical protein ACQY0O_000355 [Thecaphora frezii]